MLTKELKIDENGSYSLSTNQDGIIISVSEDFEKISAYSKSELMGKNCNMVRHPYMPKVIFKIL
jgi:PAS domain S-box-containing protein